jgi:hypothetical protein
LVSANTSSYFLQYQLSLSTQNPALQIPQQANSSAYEAQGLPDRQQPTLLLLACIDVGFGSENFIAPVL